MYIGAQSHVQAAWSAGFRGSEDAASPFGILAVLLCTPQNLLRHPKHSCRGCDGVQPILLIAVQMVHHPGLPVCWPPTDAWALSLLVGTNRVQLFRQVIRELPDLPQFSLDALSRSSSRPVSSLHSLGWSHVGDGAFMDSCGRVFHIGLVPVSHSNSLLLSTRTDKVAMQAPPSWTIFAFPWRKQPGTCCLSKRRWCCNSRSAHSFQVSLPNTSMKQLPFAGTVEGWVRDYTG